MVGFDEAIKYSNEITDGKFDATERLITACNSFGLLHRISSNGVNLVLDILALL